MSITLQLLEYKILPCHNSSTARTLTMQIKNGFFCSLKLYVALLTSENMSVGKHVLVCTSTAINVLLYTRKLARAD